MLHRSRIQNENDPRTVRGKLYTGADGPQTGKKASLGTGKALFDPENHTSSKSSKPPTAMPRKALGDITNATPAGKAMRAIKTNVGPPQVTPLVMPEAKPVLKSKVDLWAEEGIENQAGKGWKELQHAREAREDSEISSRIQKAMKQKSYGLGGQELGIAQPWKRFTSVKIPKKPPSQPASPPAGSFLDDFEELDLSEMQFSLAVPCPQLACIQT